MGGRAALVLAAIAAFAAPADLGEILTRVGEGVGRYYARAQSIICLETVRLQPVDESFTPQGFARELVYELRVAWEPPADPSAIPEASVIRQLRSVNGRPPKNDERKKDEENGCMDPQPISAEPLGMLLPAHREEYAFSFAGFGKAVDRRAMMINFKALPAGEPKVTWKGPCFSASLPGRTKGRIWVDLESDSVLRIDEELTRRWDYQVPREHRTPGSSPWFNLERNDVSIRFTPVQFHDPEETILLPESVRTLTVIRGAGAPRVRKTQTYRNYRRFMTDVRIVR
jgi:hypothetical protein